jgi:hypothetical protein
LFLLIGDILFIRVICGFIRFNQHFLEVCGVATASIEKKRFYAILEISGGGVAGAAAPAWGVPEDRPKQTGGLRRRAGGRGACPPPADLISFTLESGETYGN